MEVLASHAAHFVDAAEAGDLTRVQELLGAGVSVNAVAPDGGTALAHAASAGQLHVVEFLIGAGADVDRSDVDAKTPLMRAAEAGRIEVSRRLLAADADTNLQTLNGETALMFAAKWGSTPMLTLLIDAGADPALTSAGGRTAYDFVKVKGRVGRKARRVLRKRGGHRPKRPGRWRIPITDDFRHARAFRRVTSWAAPWGWFLWTSLPLFVYWPPILVPAYFLLLLLVVIRVFPSTVQLPLYWIRGPAGADRTAVHQKPLLTSADVDEIVRTAEDHDIAFVSGFVRLGLQKIDERWEQATRRPSLYVASHVASLALGLIVLAIPTARVAARDFLVGMWMQDVASGTGPLILSLVLLLGTRWGPLAVLAIIGMFSALRTYPRLLVFWLAAATCALTAAFIESRLRRQRLRRRQAAYDDIARDIAASLGGADAAPGRPQHFGVYLRPFFVTGQLPVAGIDVETALVYSLQPVLPIIALGQPGEHVGAGRIETSEDSWQAEILPLLEDASLIMVIPSHRSGTRWEIGVLRRHGYLDKTVFIMPPDMPFAEGRYADEWSRTVDTLRLDGIDMPVYDRRGRFFKLDGAGQLQYSAVFDAGRTLAVLNRAMQHPDAGDGSSSDESDDGDDGEGGHGDDGNGGDSGGWGWGGDGGDGGGGDGGE